MSTRTKFRKLSLGPSEKITRKNSNVGLTVISDYIDPLTNQRTLVLERFESAATAAPVKRAAKSATRKPKGANSTSPQTSFEHGANTPAATV